MELRQLRYFLAVAEHLHFTEAAAHLGIAQPPLSQQIRKLEREVGTQLFVRRPRCVELTEAGHLLRERASRIIEDSRQALIEAQNAGRGVTGRLVLGFAGSIVFHPSVAAVVQHYRNAWPSVAISCEESNSVKLLERTETKRVDAALIRTPLQCPSLVVTRLTEEPMLAVLPGGHRLSRRRRVNLAELATESFIFFPRSIGPDLHDAMIGACHAAGFTPQISMESPQISSAPNLVATGFGVALVPQSIRQINAEGASFHELEGHPLRTGIALVHRARERAPAVLNFAKAIRAVRTTR